MKSMTDLSAAGRVGLCVALTIGLSAIAHPALAQGLPANGLDTFMESIWDFLIENVVLMMIGLGAIGALIGGMVGDPGRAVGRAIACFALGAVAASIPAVSEWALSLGA